jgi:hypothetical protein
MSSSATPRGTAYAHYGARDFDFDLQLSRQFWEGDVVHTATIFRLDAVRTLVDEVYGETLAEEKSFFPPVEVTVVPNIGEVVTAFRLPGGVRHQSSSITLGFYLEELTAKACRPHDGDFVCYDAGQGPQFYELTGVDELLGSNTHAGVPFYVGAVGVLAGANAIPPGLAAWKR